MINANAVLIGDIEMYLKPFKPNRMTTRSKSYTKWDETFLDLKHSIDDDNFANDLKELFELESESLIPTEYKAKCHGITWKGRLLES